MEPTDRDSLGDILGAAFRGEPSHPEDHARQIARQVAETNRLLNIIANQLDATRQEVRTLNGSAWFIALALIVLCIATIFPKH